MRHKDKLILPRREIIKPSRRAFVKGLAGAGLLIASPAIVRAGSLSLMGAGKPPGGGGGGGLGLQTNCTAFWPLDTTSWLDASGSGNTLTGHNSPTITASGGVNWGTFNGTNQYLDIASNASIENGGGSFSVQVWVENHDGSPAVICKQANGFLQDDWLLGAGFDGTQNVWTFVVFDIGSAANRAFSLVPVSTSRTHIVGTFNGSTKQALVYVNGSLSGTGVTLPSACNSSSAPFFVSEQGTGGTFTAGLRSRAGFWKNRILSAGDVTNLYNGGTGLTWAQMA